MGVMRFFENGLRTEVEERLGLVKNFRTPPSLIVFWVVIPDHQAAYSPFLVTAHKLGNLTDQTECSRAGQLGQSNSLTISQFRQTDRQTGSRVGSRTHSVLQCSQGQPGV